MRLNFIIRPEFLEQEFIQTSIMGIFWRVWIFVIENLNIFMILFEIQTEKIRHSHQKAIGNFFYGDCLSNPSGFYCKATTRKD